MPRVLVIFTFFLSVLLFSTIPLSAQVVPSASGGSGSEDDSAMSTPPPVSGTPYASGDTRANYLDLGIGVAPAYTDNFLPSVTATPISETTVSIYPSIELDQSTTRHSERISYSPGFTFYEPSSTLDAFGQSASLGFDFRLSPHISLDLNDTFVRTSDVFNQSYPFSNPITGSTQTSLPVLIAPYAGQMVDSASGSLNYQFSRDAMIGGGGSYSNYTLINQGNNNSGLFDSTGEGGSLFYSRRISRKQYLGVSDSYSRTVASGSNLQYESQINSLLPFYTIYFSPRVSASISGGFSYIFPSSSYTGSINSWQPSITASAGWHGKRANIAGSFFRSVIAGGGLLGVYNSYGFSASGNFRISKSWNAGLSASYADVNNVIASSIATLATGSAVYGQATLGRTFKENINLNFGYQRIHEDYGAIAIISADPDSDRVFATLVYQFRKPLGR